MLGMANPNSSVSIQPMNNVTFRSKESQIYNPFDQMESELNSQYYVHYSKQSMRDIGNSRSPSTGNRSPGPNEIANLIPSIDHIKDNFQIGIGLRGTDPNRSDTEFRVIENKNTSLNGSNNSGVESLMNRQSPKFKSLHQRQ